MRIAILDLTSHPEPLLAGMPRVGRQITDWLAPALPEATLTSIGVAEEGLSLPQIDAFDGLLVSGSEYGVYDNVPWMRPLRDLLLQTRKAGKPVYGICFGHQIMADTFGGRAEKAASGLAVGAVRFRHDDRETDAYVWHQDQVTAVPPNARVTASAAHCPVGALDYEFPAASVQFHPEYTKTHLQDIFTKVRGIFLDPDQADRALQSLDTSSVPSGLLADKVAAFFRCHLDG
jgi:GMP synthase-like glutamine amidotransferase